jgi:hypothetical protein
MRRHQAAALGRKSKRARTTSATAEPPPPLPRPMSTVDVTDEGGTVPAHGVVVDAAGLRAVMGALEWNESASVRSAQPIIGRERHFTHVRSFIGYSPLTNSTYPVHIPCKRCCRVRVGVDVEARVKARRGDSYSTPATPTHATPRGLRWGPRAYWGGI